MAAVRRYLIAGLLVWIPLAITFWVVSLLVELMDQSLLAAIKAKEIDPDDAFAYSNDKRLFAKHVVDRSLLPRIETLE